MTERTAREWWPTVMYRETHPVECICGGCKNTACIATIRLPSRSAEEYQRNVEIALRRR